MFVDWAHAVRDAIQFSLAERLRIAGCDAEASYLETLLLGRGPRRLASLIEVEEPPAKLGFAVSTPVAFKLSALLAGSAENRQNALRPLDLGRLLADAVNATAGDSFTVECAPSGHLNANPTPSYQHTFFATIERRGPEALYSEAPIGIGARGEELDGLGRSPRVDIGTLEALLREARSDEPAAVDAIVDRLRSGDQRKDFGALLMVLAALGDPELSFGPYLKGFGGRENVPWYLDRFRHAARALLEHATSPPEVHAPDARIAVGDFGAADELRTTILTLRASHRTAVRMKRPEVLLSQLLRGVRAFFALYNRPEIRAGTLPLEDMRTIRQLASIAEGAVELGLCILYASANLGAVQR